MKYLNLQRNCPNHIDLTQKVCASEKLSIFVLLATHHSIQK